MQESAQRVPYDVEMELFTVHRLREAHHPPRMASARSREAGLAGIRPLCCCLAWNGWPLRDRHPAASAASMGFGREKAGHSSQWRRRSLPRPLRYRGWRDHLRFPVHPEPPQCRLLSKRRLGRGRRWAEVATCWDRLAHASADALRGMAGPARGAEFGPAWYRPLGQTHLGLWQERSHRRPTSACRRTGRRRPDEGGHSNLESLRFAPAHSIPAEARPAREGRFAGFS